MYSQTAVDCYLLVTYLSVFGWFSLKLAEDLLIASLPECVAVPTGFSWCKRTKISVFELTADINQNENLIDKLT